MRSRTFVRFRPPTGKGSQYPKFAKQIKCPTCNAAVWHDCLEPCNICPQQAHAERVTAARAAGHDTRRRVANGSGGLQHAARTLAMALCGDEACEGMMLLSDWPPLMPGEFEECVRILDMIPDGKARLSTVAERLPGWAPVLANWDRWVALLCKQRLRQLYEEMAERVPAPPGYVRTQLKRKRSPWRRSFPVEDA